MTKLVVTLNDGSYINVPADRMEMQGDFLLGWLGKELVAVVELTAIITAKLSRKEE